MTQTLKEKCDAIAIRKREELEASLDTGDVADPISILISVAVSTALTGASYLISKALTPKPPRQQQGKLTGSLQLQNSEQGIFIPEIYGGSPSVSFVAGSNLTYQNNANGTTESDSGYTKTSGGSTTWNCGASHNVQINAGDQAWVKFKVLSGYAAMGFTTTASPVSGNADFKFGIQWNPDGSVSIKYNNTAVLGAVTTWVAGDEFTVWMDTRFRLFKGAAEITPPNFIFPAPAFPLWAGIAVQTLNAGITEAKVQINNLGPAPNSGRGGIKIPAIIVWSSGIRKLVTTSQVPTGGGKGGGQRTQTVDNITYDIDLGMMFGRGPNSLIRLYANADILIDQFVQSANPSGVYDPGTGADPNYDPTLPPDPTLNHLLPNLRVDGDIAFDGDSVGTGTIQGGGSGFAIYPGNNTQQPDPIIEADIDGKYGSGSTPAYRNHSLVRLSTLSLSRWGGVVPNITGVWEHETLRTLDDIFASMCERVGVLTADGDYDFTDIPIESRGLLISGRPFQPKEVIDSPDLQLAYNYFVTEADGQVVGYTEGNEPSVTIPDTEIGWLEGDADLPDIAPEVDSAIAAEITLPREVHVKSLDPDNDWEPNTANAMRQITDGSAVELLEIQICQLSDERRETAQRKLYRDYVAGTSHKFTLPWTYLYLHPGYKITVTRAEGFTHVMRLRSIDGGIGILNCEGIALETETFNQPVNGVFPPGYIPPQPIPAMTILSLLDTPLLRDGDETNNNGVGFYVCGTPRTGVNQNWTGFALYVSKNGTWNLIGDSNLPGTIGTIVSATSLSGDTTIFDTTGHFIVDLYGTTATLSSITQADALADGTKNLAVVGDMVIQFVTASQVAGFPNRWDLSVLLNGRRGTEGYISDSFTGKRFVLIDGAVKFVPMELSDLNNLLNYRGVTNGQSLGDAATVQFAWSGGTKKPPSIVNARGTRDSGNDLLVEFEGRTRLGGGLRSEQAGAVNEEVEEYRVQILNSGSTTLPNGRERIMTVIPGMQQAAILMGKDGFTGISHNSVISQTSGASVQYVHGPDNIIEATLRARISAFFYSLVALLPPGVKWQTLDWGNDFPLPDTLPASVAFIPYVVVLEALPLNQQRLRVWEYGTKIFSASDDSGEPDYDANFGWFSLGGNDTMFRIKFNFVGSSVRIQKTHTLSVPFTTIVTGTRQVVYPLFVYAQAGTSTFPVQNVIMTTYPFPKTIYSAAQQTEDGFTPGNPIQMDIWQYSKLIGDGIKTRVTL